MDRPKYKRPKFLSLRSSSWMYGRKVSFLGKGQIPNMARQKSHKPKDSNGTRPPRPKTLSLFLRLLWACEMAPHSYVFAIGSCSSLAIPTPRCCDAVLFLLDLLAFLVRIMCSQPWSRVNLDHLGIAIKNCEGGMTRAMAKPPHR